MLLDRSQGVAFARDISHGRCVAGPFMFEFLGTAEDLIHVR